MSSGVGMPWGWVLPWESAGCSQQGCGKHHPTGMLSCLNIPNLFIATTTMVNLKFHINQEYPMKLIFEHVQGLLPSVLSRIPSCQQSREILLDTTTSSPMKEMGNSLNLFSIDFNNR